MNNFKEGVDICESCTRRRCKLRPKNNTCTKYAATKYGWTMKEVMHDKALQT